MPANRGSLLVDWDALSKDEQWSGILLGNGASMAVWPSFGYVSLFEEARSANVSRPLTEPDIALFEALDSTRNFEQVLDALNTGRIVTHALGRDVDFLIERYQSIQHALFDAVRSVHVPWAEVSTKALAAIRSALRVYGSVYSTNYDLLVYWSIMNEPRGAGFVDLFWGEDNTFDPTNTEIWSPTTLVLYLHGGLHLHRGAAGGTAKQVSSVGGGLLDQFGSSLEAGSVPLLVSEGTSKDKLRTILSSDYLTFGYEHFSNHEGPLVVFGHSLSSGDAHLVQAMRKWGDRRIAISLRQGDPAKVEERIAEYEARLPHADLVFFDAATHPLGAAELDMTTGPFTSLVRRISPF